MHLLQACFKVTVMTAFVVSIPHKLGFWQVVLIAMFCTSFHSQNDQSLLLSLMEEVFFNKSLLSCLARIKIWLFNVYASTSSFIFSWNRFQISYFTFLSDLAALTLKIAQYLKFKSAWPIKSLIETSTLVNCTGPTVSSPHVLHIC